MEALVHGHDIYRFGPNRAKLVRGIVIELAVGNLLSNRMHRTTLQNACEICFTVFLTVMNDMDCRVASGLEDTCPVQVENSLAVVAYGYVALNFAVHSHSLQDGARLSCQFPFLSAQLAQ